MIKHIIFDFGGVILDLGGKHTGIPQDLASIFSAPVETIKPIWDKNKSNLLTGKESPKEFLRFLTKELKVSIDIPQALKEWETLNILTRNKIDWKLIQYIESLRKTYQVHMLTDQIDVNNGPAQWKEEIEDKFHTMFRSYTEGYHKPDISAYENVLNKINARGEECIFIDDSELNIQAAESIGMKGILYRYGEVDALIAKLHAYNISV